MSEGAGGWLTAGRVGRPHGLDGSFHVADPRPLLLEVGQRLAVRGRPIRIVLRKGTTSRPIIRLENTDDRDAADALRGEPLLVARDHAPALGDDEWWAEDLEGCAVRCSGRQIGTVKRLLAFPSCEALEVSVTGGGPELLVPLVSDAVRAVDVDRREIEVNLDFINERPD